MIKGKDIAIDTNYDYIVNISDTHFNDWKDDTSESIIEVSLALTQSKKKILLVLNGDIFDIIQIKDFDKLNGNVNLGFLFFNNLIDLENVDIAYIEGNHDKNCIDYISNLFSKIKYYSTNSMTIHNMIFLHGHQFDVTCSGFMKTISKFIIKLVGRIERKVSFNDEKYQDLLNAKIIKNAREFAKKRCKKLFFGHTHEVLSENFIVNSGCFVNKKENIIVIDNNQFLYFFNVKEFKEYVKKHF